MAASKLRLKHVVAGEDTPDPETWNQFLWDKCDFWPSWVATELSGLVCQVLYVPSFHPEFSVALNENAAELALVSFKTNLWYWNCYERQKANGKWRVDDRPPAPPERWTEVGSVNADQLASFRRRLPTRLPVLADKMEHIGCDGIMVYCQVRYPNGAAQFSKSWGASEPGAYGMALAVYESALQVLSEQESRQVLENMKYYIH